MEAIFFTLQDFMAHTKEIIYLMMGGILIGMTLFWLFLTGRDEKNRYF